MVKFRCRNATLLLFSISEITNFSFSWWRKVLISGSTPLLALYLGWLDLIILRKSKTLQNTIFIRPFDEVFYWFKGLKADKNGMKTLFISAFGSPFGSGQNLWWTIWQKKHRLTSKSLFSRFPLGNEKYGFVLSKNDVFLLFWHFLSTFRASIALKNHNECCR